MKKLTLIPVVLSLITIPLMAQMADGGVALRGAIGPAITLLMSFDLDETAFARLGNFSGDIVGGDFDIADADNDLPINGNMLIVTGFEGFGEVAPHWTIGMHAGFGDYIAHAQDAALVDYMVEFRLSQAAISAEFNTHARSKTNLLAGSQFGIGQASLKASSSPENESWDAIIGGDSTRTAFEVSAWTPLIQPYLGMRMDISRSMGFKVVAGYNYQAVDRGSWRLYHKKTISDSPEVPLSALFFRFQLFVLL